jgi:hypothetical protein
MRGVPVILPRGLRRRGAVAPPPQHDREAGEGDGD